MSSLAFALAAALSATPAPPVVLRVGLDPRSPPWAFTPGYDSRPLDYLERPRLSLAQIERLVGLELDVQRALERRLGVRFQIVPTRWLDLEADLLASRYDVILNAWTPTPTTPPEILATDPYYAWGLLVAARGDDASLQTVADLAGRRVGHISDPTVLAAVRAMADSLGAKRVVVDAGGGEMFGRLARGELDAVIFDSAYVRWRVARDAGFRIVGEPLNQLGYHAGVRATDRPLWERLQAAIQDFVVSDEARAIRRRWESAATPAP